MKGWCVYPLILLTHPLWVASRWISSPVCLDIHCRLSELLWLWRVWWVRKAERCSRRLRGICGMHRNCPAPLQLKSKEVTWDTCYSLSLSLFGSIFALYRIHSVMNSLRSWPAANPKKDLRQESYCSKQMSLVATGPKTIIDIHQVPSPPPIQDFPCSWQSLQLVSYLLGGETQTFILESKPTKGLDSWSNWGCYNFSQCYHRTWKNKGNPSESFEV